MTTVPVVSEIVPDQYALFSWTGLVPGDDGEPVEIFKWGNRTLQCVGTPTNVSIEGNNLPDILPWYSLLYGNLTTWALMVPARPLYANGPGVLNPRFIRPKVGGAITATFLPVTISLFCVAGQP